MAVKSSPRSLRLVYAVSVIGAGLFVFFDTISILQL